ncbi:MULTISPECIES: tRNA glutamyl-Q(34) synthetase GluQRS [unclassified Vibrio]|uniref:Glutamyl-Q tRNA(Asp) synthetase n=1 Tax=Vibrio sp. HB236076 TaxID=3232307 RepID=A0AB39H8N2_9VIBR|nr:tRNA glutamyl-Q(34) synthetase GluQRS [Vibrio sp. HB161653]MDP5254019.1 tRNA glutamyl-Q(34) synthetase GluQRS [Vibrio sp. HB161653]
MRYIGRFAPSPSGPLHFGSLIAALGSYFQAKSQGGLWRVRIEDLDPPREMAGAADQILRTLERYQLHWDGEVVYQSHRHDLYQAQIDHWLSQGQAYYCQCTRKEVQQSGGFYQGRCRKKQWSTGAIRLQPRSPIYQFHDRKHGVLTIPDALAREDFIIKRKDGLFAYNLAVVIDDIEQGITEVVRGADLIEPTGRQISLYHQLKKTPVSYLHLPLATTAQGLKLSKQNHAPALDEKHPRRTLLAAMNFLGFKLEANLKEAKLAEILHWGVENWTLNQLPNQLSIPQHSQMPSVEL